MSSIKDKRLLRLESLEPSPRNSPRLRRRLNRQSSINHAQSRVKACLLCAIFALSATFLVLVFLCWGQPGCFLNTVFTLAHREEVLTLIRANDRVADEAEMFLKQLWLKRGSSVLTEFQERLDEIKATGERQANGHPRPDQAGETRIVLAIVTVTRPRNPRYLTQVVASLVQQLVDEVEHASKRRHRKSSMGDIKTSLFILAADCFDGDLSYNPELQLVSKFVPVLTRNSQTEPLSDCHQCAWSSWSPSYCRRVVQENEDYIMLLEKALSFRPDLLIALEDDAVALPYLVPKLHRLLQSKQLRPLSNGSMSWAFVKLAYPLKWSGFEKYSIHWILATGFLVATAFVAMIPHLFKWRRSQWERHKWLMYKAQIVLCIIGATYFVVILEVIGRQSAMGWLEPAPVWHRVVPAQGCCTQAQLYSAESAGFYITKFHREEASLFGPENTAGVKHALLPIDLWLDREVRPYTRWMVEPNMFRHIGTISSLGKNDRVTG